MAPPLEDLTSTQVAGFRDEALAQALAQLPALRTATKPSKLSFSKVSCYALETSMKIHKEHNVLWQILERHESQIRKLWLSKTHSQRASILDNAWRRVVGGPMAQQHRPDIAAWILESKNIKGEYQTEYRDAYRWPYINLEDLTKSNAFLIFINSRGRNPPHMFAHADLLACRFGQRGNALKERTCAGWTMLLSGRDMPDTYGAMFSYPQGDRTHNSPAERWLHSGIGFDPGNGYLVLGIQLRVLQFLTRCCLLVLQEPGNLFAAKFPIQPPPAPLSMNDGEFPSMAASALETPYRLPADFDLRNLRGIISSQCSAAAYHIEALRENPGYFADTCMDTSEHIQVFLTQPGPGRSRYRSVYLDPKGFCNEVQRWIIVEAYEAYWTFEAVHRMLNEVIALKELHSERISVETDLPEKYGRKLQELRFFVFQVVQSYCIRITKAVNSSPELRDDFIRNHNTDAQGRDVYRFEPKDKKDMLLLSLTRLGRLGDTQNKEIGLPAAMDEIFHFMENNPQESHKRLSTFVTGLLSQLGSLVEIQRQTNLYLPWVVKLDRLSATSQRNTRVKWFVQERSEFLSLEKTVMLMTDLNEDPCHGKFAYPDSSNKTQAIVDRMRKSETNLDEFWGKIDARCISGGIPQHQILLKTHLSAHPNRVIYRTPAWVDPSPESEDKDKEQRTANVFIKSSTPYIPIPSGEWQQSRQVSTEEATKPKKKEKTKGIARPKGHPGDNAPEGEAHSEIPVVFKLKQKDYDTFSILFYTPGQANLPGELPWTDFLHALMAVGLAPQKLFGSVWNFSPTNGDIGRSIIFHEPHGSMGHKIPFNIARHHGRMLNHRYQWTIENFEVE